VPVATHNQRGLGTLHLGLPEACDTDVDAEALLAIVEDAMSSEIYELMKRSGREGRASAPWILRWSSAVRRAWRTPGRSTSGA
jgi:hypothetical protein